jgi:putative GTP pyrophosphokinase
MRKFTNSKVNNAGKILTAETNINPKDINEAENILTYWRYIHLPILNTFQATLRQKISSKFKKQGFVSQRLKRRASIVSKLKRERNMKLSTMQDIAGIRAVMTHLKDVSALANELKKSKAKHNLINEYNYITNPKKSGYRSIHLIFQYDNPKNAESNGLRIEVQIRTKLQHIWATTVETLGTFMNTSLKSSEGPLEILDFLNITSSAFAIIEKCPVNPEHQLLNNEQIYKSVSDQYDRLNIADKLKGFSVAAKHIEGNLTKENYQYYLITLNLTDKFARVKGYSRNELDNANDDYTEIERSIRAGANLQVVLVSTDKLSALTKAYPSYFLDSTDFIKQIEKIKFQLLENN